MPASSVRISPQPSDEEAAAIAVALEVMWPRPAAHAPAPSRRSAWRFSGRWWSRPLPSRRDRPFR